MVNSSILSPVGWSEELVKEAWRSDREGACEKAGLKDSEEPDCGRSIPTAAASLPSLGGGAGRVEGTDGEVGLVQGGGADKRAGEGQGWGW